MNDKLRLLILAYYFPPDSSSGALRPLFFARHLHDLGVQVSVLTALEEDFLPEQPKDPELISQIGKNIHIVRARVKRPREYILSLRPTKTKKRAIEKKAGYRHLTSKKINRPYLSLIQVVKDTITDLLASPDPHIGWVPDTVRSARRIIREKQINIIWATGSPWSCLIAGIILGKKTKLPIILDFRDPWVANPGFVQRGKIAGFFETLMERYIVAQADAIIANTQELRDSFIQRYSFLSKDNVFTIPNGYENIFNSMTPANKKFTITHAGGLYFSRTPLPFLQSLYDLIEKGIILKDKIEVLFVGGMDFSDERLKGLLNSEYLCSIVRVIPRLPHREALMFQLKSDALLLVQPGFPLQVPRKLYEYMAMQRPILALTDESGATARTIKQCGLGRVVQNRTHSIKPVLLQMYRDWENGNVTIPESSKIEPFKNINLSKELKEILRRTKNNVAARRVII